MISDKQSAQGGYFSGGLLLFCGILTAPIGFMGVLASGFTYIGIIMLLLAVGGSLLIYSGIQYIRAAGKLQKDEQALQQQLSSNGTAVKPDSEKGVISEGTKPAEPTPTKLVLPDVHIIAEWETDPSTWQQFTINERKYRNEDNIYFFIAVLILGTLVLMLSRSASFWLALGISAGMGAIIVYIRRSLSLSNLQPGNQKSARRVIISDAFVSLNGHTFDLFSASRNTRKVRFLPDESPAILEFTIEWMTRKGPTFDELRVPVPAANFQQAAAVVQYFQKKD